MEFEKYPQQYWHCYLLKKKPRGEKHVQEEYVNDLQLEKLIKEVVLPWRESRRFAVSGLFVQNSSEVEKIQIVHTLQTSVSIAAGIRSRMARGVFIPVDSRQVPFLQEHSTDYTTDFLFSNDSVKPLPRNSLSGHGTKSRFERSFIRLLIKDVIKTDPDLDAFCLDKFENVFHRFTGQMDRTTKLNLLLQQDLDEIYEALKSLYPDEVQRAEE